ncbi:MAG TPA: peptidylprolyl isomerase [Acidimicrobiales bacterium]
MAQKRPSQRQRDHLARQAALRARERKEQRKKLGIVVVTAVLLILGVSAFVSGDGGGDSTDVASTGSTAAGARAAPAALTPPPTGATISGDTPCPPTDGSAQRTTTFAKPPPMCINPSRTYTAEFTTTKGRFTVALDARAAPNTVNNFVVLARYKFYEGIPFHRAVPGFVIQGGDPQATGTGGPGYRFNDELPPQGAYKIGSVAMANSGPNTNGSQFFIVTGESGAVLQPNYSLFGTVTEGMDIVKSIEAVGTPETPTDPNGGKPTQQVTISSITIKES